MNYDAMHPMLAFCVGLPVLSAVSGGVVLLAYLVFVISKLPRLPPEIDSKRELRWFLVRNRLFLSYIYVKGKINGKTFVENSRAAVNTLLKPQPSTVPGSKVKSSVKFFDGVWVRFYEPVAGVEGEQVPGLVYIHGGGFIAGSADSYDQITRKIAEVIEGVVISVDYRLAPENPFPAGFDDCMTATKYFLKNTNEFGVDPTRVAVCGDSAGGNLTAGVVQKLCCEPTERQGICKPKLQILLYPVLQMLDLFTPSYQQHNATFGMGGGFLPSNSIAWMTPRYLTGTKDGALTKALLKGSVRGVAAAREGEVLREALSHKLVATPLKSGTWYSCPEPCYATAVGSAEEELWERFRPHVTDSRIMPLFKEDLTGLPPAYVVTCDFDVLRDDGTIYAERLRRAGVQATLDNYRGAIHGLMFFPQFKWGREARKKFYTFLKDNL